MDLSFLPRREEGAYREYVTDEQQRQKRQGLAIDSGYLSYGTLGGTYCGISTTRLRGETDNENDKKSGVN